ncbi:MAG: Ig-like domain-containing protein [Hominilimicola sp.]
MKKLLAIITSVSMLFTAGALGAYRVETDDDTYVSDEIYFDPVSTWDAVNAQTINLKKGRLIFYAGRENEPQRIEATVMPVNTTNKTLTYKSEDISIASVDADGYVTPNGKVGETVIDIECGRAKSKIKISVVKGVEGVAMSQSAMTLYADKPVTAQLSALIAPQDATIQDVKWYSEDETIAYVDNEGLVSPCGVGTTDIYAKTLDGGFSAKCTVTVTTWEKRKEDIPVEYVDYPMTIEEMVEKQMTASPTIFTNEVLPADENSVEKYVNPENLVSGYDKYQFMDLGSSNNIDAQTLDAYLNGKGILSGNGDTFKSAAETNNISEVYLGIHACLESGNGTSQLACGVEYKGVTVYNLFGIGALDAAPVQGGAQYAYEQGWTTVEKAIEGGAEWISENYINNPKYSQNTLYKMRWNPDKPAVHQYATDIAWASKQARDMSAMFEAFPTAEYHFEIPVFEGQDELKLN